MHFCLIGIPSALCTKKKAKLVSLLSVLFNSHILKLAVLSSSKNGFDFSNKYLLSCVQASEHSVLSPLE